MYKTQMEAARKGIVTKEMEAVAKKEYRTAEEIREAREKLFNVREILRCKKHEQGA